MHHLRPEETPPVSQPDIGQVVDEGSTRWLQSYSAWKQLQSQENRVIWQGATRRGWISLGLTALFNLGLVVAVAIGIVSKSEVVVPTALLLFGLGNLALARFLWWGEKGWVKRETERLETVDEAGPLPDQWMIRLSVIEDGAVAGTDLGTMWFEDGRLMFSGQFMSFAIAPGDLDFTAHQQLRKLQPRRPWFGVFRLCLNRTDGKPRQEITFDIVRRGAKSFSVIPESEGTGYDASLHAKLIEFAAEDASQLGQRPPRGIGPGFREPRREFPLVAFYTVAVATAVVVGLNLASQLIRGGDWFLSILLLVLGFLALLAYLFLQGRFAVAAFLGSRELAKKARIEEPPG